MRSKQIKLGLLTLLMISSLVGCNNGNRVESEAMETDDAIIADEITESGHNKEEFEYYSYRTGSSSVSEGYVLYAYGDAIIFAADYFCCGNGFAETYVLNEEQVAELEKQLEKGMVADERKEKSHDEEKEGSSSTSAKICFSGQCYPAKALNLLALDIELKDAGEIQYLEAENDWNLEVDADLQSLWHRKDLFVGSYEYEQLVGSQVDMLLDGQIRNMTICEIGEEDYQLEVVTTKEEVYYFTVTMWGYVVP